MAKNGQQQTNKITGCGSEGEPGETREARTKVREKDHPNDKFYGEASHSTLLTTGKIKGKRNRGREREKMLDGLAKCHRQRTPALGAENCGESMIYNAIRRDNR